MKWFKSLIISFVIAAILLPATVLAYKPVFEGLDDIRWFGGYDPASGLSVISDVPKGVKVAFKKDPTMWANRVVAGWDYNLSSTDSLNAGVKPDEEGIYMKLVDLKWDIPKGTPSLPNPQPSVMISLSNSQGGWSDGPALMFWIIRTKDGYIFTILRGYNAGEPNQEQFAIPYMELPHAIGNEINFYLRRTSATEWTLRINENVIKLDHAKIMAERFSSFNPMGLSLGTWNSGGPVECTVTDLWGYGVIEYGGKKGGKYVVNPEPAFVKTVKTEKAPTAAPTKAPTAAASNTTSNPASVSSSTTDPTESAVSMDSEVLSGESVMESTDASSVDSNSTDVKASAIESMNDESSQDAQSKDDDKDNKMNPLIWIVVAIALVVVGGGVAYYFLFMRSKV